MKKIYLAFLVLVLLNSTILFGQTGWQPLTTGTNAYLTSIFFTDALTGYVGGQAILLKTTDGGLSWAALMPGISSGFVRKIEFLNSTTGYICGDNGVIKKTTNAGLNWITLNPGIASTIASVAISDSLNVYAVSNSGLFLKSTDGGNTWNQIAVTTSYQLLSLDCVSKDTIYTAGTSGILFKSLNGGLNWNQIPTGTTNNIWDLFLIDNKTLSISAYYGTLRNTFDGGNSFISGFGNNVNFEGSYFVNKMVGYSCGLSGSIYKTTNGGQFWVQQTSNTPNSLTEMIFVNASTGYIAGSSGTVLKTTDGGGDNFNLTLLNPNGGRYYNLFDTVKILWSSIIQGNVKLEFTSNNGTSWNTISTSVPAGTFEYQWYINSSPGNNYKIKITSITNPTLYDESNSLFGVVSATYANVPELLYYKFNAGTISTPNYAIPGIGTLEATVSGHTLQPGGLYDSALVGGGSTGSTHFVNTKWATSLPKRGWTIGFWVSNISLGTTPTNPVYLFGDATANNFRCYYAGSGGVGTTDTAIMLRATGMNDVRVPVVKGNSYFIHFVYDSASSNIKAYKNGILSVTIPQTQIFLIGNGPFYIGAHSTLASSLSQNMKIDEFRIYDRALSQSEINSTYNLTLPSLITSIKQTGTEQPERIELYQNYPNPFNASTVIGWQLSKSSNVRITLYDITGKEINSLVSGFYQPGYYKVKLEAEHLTSGTYFYKLQTSGYTATKSMILLK